MRAEECEGGIGVGGGGGADDGWVGLRCQMG